MKMPRRPPLPARPLEGRASSRLPAADFLGVQTPPAVVSGDTPITGKLSFSGPTRIDAVLRGEVHATDLLIVGERGLVEGTVRAAQLIVNGTVRGEICGADRVEIGAHGRVEGSVEAAALVIRQGGFFDGDCRRPK